jgi:hypothetical protein
MVSFTPLPLYPRDIAQRLRIFQNRVPRRIFEPERNEVTGTSRKLHNEEFHYFVFTTSIIIIMK